MFLSLIALAHSCHAVALLLWLRSVANCAGQQAPPTAACARMDVHACVCCNLAGGLLLWLPLAAMEWLHSAQCQASHMHDCLAFPQQLQARPIGCWPAAAAIQLQESFSPPLQACTPLP